jgi:hypothetical protein
MICDAINAAACGTLARRANQLRLTTSCQVKSKCLRFSRSGMRRRDKIAKLFCAEGAGPESIAPQ